MSAETNKTQDVLNEIESIYNTSLGNVEIPITKQRNAVNELNNIRPVNKYELACYEDVNQFRQNLIEQYRPISEQSNIWQYVNRYNVIMVVCFIISLISIICLVRVFFKQ